MFSLLLNFFLDSLLPGRDLVPLWLPVCPSEVLLPITSFVDTVGLSTCGLTVL